MNIRLKITLIIFVISASLFTQCSNKEKFNMKINKEPFGSADGVEVYLFTLTNDNGMTVKITNYGGIITSVLVPDKNGKFGDVVLGFDNVNDYVKDNPYFGAIIGRYGNRIAKGEFILDGKTYSLAINNPPNHLHGGPKGFHKVIWEPEEVKTDSTVGVQLKYLSKDGEEGYPGNLSVTVNYTLTKNNEIKIDYSATTDQKTICNLTNHSYFNLKDGGVTNILDHELMINADNYTPIDSTLIPTGEIVNVEGTPFDFRKLHKIGDEINADNEQIKFGRGYDHNFVLNGEMGKMRLVAKAFEPTSGRVLQVYTDQPGIQFYSGNFLDGTLTGKNGIVYNYRNGFCLETQHFPDSPNESKFPSTVLSPNETYKTETIYKFSVQK